MATKASTEILIAAKRRIERGWCQGLYNSDDGSCCPVGALISAANGKQERLMAAQYLREAIPSNFTHIEGWNDAPGRTKDEVLAAFDRAIELSKAAAR